MVFYAVLAAVQLREQPRQKLSERAPNRARSSAGGVGPFRRASSHCFLDDGERSRGFATRTLAYERPHADARANARIARCCAATSGITNHSLLPAAQSFAAPNLNTLHFTSIGASGPQRKHERPADRSRPKAGQRQRAGPSSRSLPGSRALAVAVARRCPRQRGRLPVPARADQAADARAVLPRRPRLSPATVLLLFLCVRREVRGGRRHETEAVHEGPGRQRVERTPELEDRGERYRRDIAPARHLTGR